MTFDRAWVLPFTLLPLFWMAWEMRRTRRRGAVALKALSFCAIALALAEPNLHTSETKMAVAVLVDTSSSVASQDLARESQLATALDKDRGRHWVRVLPFAGAPRVAAASEHTGDWHLQYTSGDAGQSTDLEAAVRAGIAELPPNMVPRLVLISDGKENAGSITRAAWQAQSLGIPIDTFALNGKPEPSLRLESVSLPTVAFTGERFPVDVMVIAPRAVTGKVEIQAEGKLLGSNAITLEAGANQVRLHPSIGTAGATNLSAVIATPDLGEVRFDRAMTLRRPRVLYVSQDPEGTEQHLMQTLAAGQFDVDRVNDLGKSKFSDYQIVAFNNWDLESLPAERKAEAEQFVKQGGGLLVIGGERNIYDDKKKVEDAMDRALPAKVAPPKSPEGTCVVLIIDKSSSMEGKKIELARQSAIGVIDNLRPIDSVGVLIFDNSFQWAVPIRKAEDRSLIKRLVSGITPDGGTQIAPALTEAFRKVIPVKATFKHIVLLTDGISEEGDSLELSREAMQQHVTISTVGLGQDVNRGYLEKVATLAGGKAYFLNEPTGLEQILLKDVMEHTGSTAIEKTLKPTVTKRVEILDGVGVEVAPALKGYVKFEAKPSAETILSIDDKDPLLSRWQYGLGRSIVFASDAKSRWAADWVTLERLRQVLDQRVSRPAAALGRGRGSRGIRQRQRRSGGGLPAGPQCRGAQEAAGDLRDRAERVPEASSDYQAGGWLVPRQGGHRAEAGAVPNPSLGRIAGVSRSRLLSAGAGTAGLRFEPVSAERDRRLHRRPFQPESARCVRCRRAQHCKHRASVAGAVGPGDRAEPDRAVPAQGPGREGLITRYRRPPA